MLIVFIKKYFVTATWSRSVSAWHSTAGVGWSFIHSLSPSQHSRLVSERHIPLPASKAVGPKGGQDFSGPHEELICESL